MKLLLRTSTLLKRQSREPVTATECQVNKLSEQNASQNDAVATGTAWRYTSKCPTDRASLFEADSHTSYRASCLIKVSTSSSDRVMDTGPKM